MADSDNIAWLMNWYLAQCNEDWEHQNGVLIDTLDNPGWSLTIDLEGTSLAGKPFKPVFENIPEVEAEQGLDGDVRWMVARVEGLKFKAYGGPRDLSRLIEVFREWATETGCS
ncbi:MAG TPA: immunity 53 family protein [Rhizomicrobium sp.]|nr:immunity 53 family protein [Rhizomicrobium sp.]